MNVVGDDAALRDGWGGDKEFRNAAGGYGSCLMPGIHNFSISDATTS